MGDGADVVARQLRAASDAFGRAGHRLQEARARLELAMRLLGLEQVDAAFAEFRRAADLCDQEGADLCDQKGGPQWMGRALLGCAHALTVEGLHERSLLWFEKAIKRFEACGDTFGTVEAEAGRLQALGELQRWDAVDRSRRIIAIVDHNSDVRLRVYRLVALRYEAQSLVAQRDYAGAVDPATQAADVAGQLGDRDMEVRLQLVAAHSLRLAKRFPEAADVYEHVVTLTDSMPDAADLAAQALEGLATVLRDSPKTAASRLLEMVDKYTATGDTRMEALCRYQRAECLARIPHGSHEERAAEYARAAALFDATGTVEESGRSWYGAASAYNSLGMLDPRYCELCYATSSTAADRFAAAGDWFGKGLAEFLAGQALRKDDPRSLPDPRNLSMRRRSVDSFACADRPVESALSMMWVAVELTRSAGYETWMATAISALRSYEKARPRLQMPPDRERNDSLLTHGVQILTTQTRQAALTIGESPQWAELVWLLEQTSKARSFQDQHLQGKLWKDLVATDEILPGLMGTMERLTVEQDALNRYIDAVLLSRRIDEDVHTKAEQRQANEKKLEEVRRQVRDRLQEMAHAKPDQIDLVSVSPPSVEGLQARLYPGEAFLGYLWNGGAPLRSIVTSDTFSVAVTDSIPAQHVEWATDAGRRGETLSDIDPADAAELLGPIPDSVDTLIISPDQLLVGLPWHQLPCPSSADADRTLGDRYTIAIVPAAGVLCQLRITHRGSQRGSRQAAYLGVACDGRGGGGPALNCVDGEVEGVVRNYFADDASSGCLTTPNCGRFLETGCNARLLHLACHADRGGLLLSRNGTWTTPVDLLGAPGRTFGADILLLTGCHAGDFSEHENNEFLGIVRQLIVVTGARAAIISVAPVLDAAAPVFADLVVSALTGHNPGRPWGTPAQPLTVGPAVTWARQTLRGLRGEHVAPLIPNPVPGWVLEPDNPEWWSPWFVFGDPRASII